MESGWEKLAKTAKGSIANMTKSSTDAATAEVLKFVSIKFESTLAKNVFPSTKFKLQSASVDCVVPSNWDGNEFAPAYSSVPNVTRLCRSARKKLSFENSYRFCTSRSHRPKTTFSWVALPVALKNTGPMSLGYFPTESSFWKLTKTEAILNRTPLVKLQECHASPNPFTRKE